MRIGLISIFPEMFQAISNFGVTKRAVNQNLLNLDFFNPRDFTEDKHQSVDDRPFGGGPGMIMLAEPLTKAVKAAKQNCQGNSLTIYLSPQGKQLTQSKVQKLAQNYENLILVCGRYEGVDERFIESQIDEEISIGDYVLTGGELPAMVLIDAIARFIPGVLGKMESALNDSFMTGLLDCPHYTRPKIWGDRQVPAVLLSGDHSKIADWRLEQSMLKTLQNRPELLDNLALTDKQKQILDKIKQEIS